MTNGHGLGSDIDWGIGLATDKAPSHWAGWAMTWSLECGAVGRPGADSRQNMFLRTLHGD